MKSFACFAPLAIASGLALAAVPATAATVTFEPLAGESSFGVPAVLSQAGFTLTYAPTGGGGFFIIGAPPSCTPSCSTNGTNAYYSYNSGALTITAANGSLFSLASFDAATTFTTINRALSISLTGVSTGGPVSATVTRAAGAADSFSTFSPSGFTNLSSLTFSPTAGASSTEYALDNIVLNAVAVPEATTWAMMIVGVGVVGGALRRRVSVSYRPHAA